jgi:lipopolysaccharide/colanic/teichoic acid biosynthesis glycosyltransferase
VNLSLERKMGFGRQADFLVLAASWFAFGSLFQSGHTPTGLFIAWVLLTTSLLILFLDAIGYFDRHIPQPELSGVLSLFIALPLAAFCSRWIIAWIAQSPLLPYHEMLRASVWVAMAFELCQWLIFKVHQFTGRQWVMATCLKTEELEILRDEIDRTGSQRWIKIQPVNTSDSSAALQGHETLVISRGAVHDLKTHPEFLMAHLRGQRIVDINHLLKEFRRRLDLRTADAWSFLLGTMHQSFLIRLYFNMKAFLEPILAGILLVVFSPLLLLISLGIYLSNGRPILYRQERLGYRGERFLLFKFRSMKLTAETTGPQWASKDDPRVTPLGRFLRKSRLDELPQLLNVLRGELSFVGPRPERPEFYRLLNQQIPLFSLRLLVRPGITGWAQVLQGYVASVEDCKTKLEYDLYYVQNMSPALDLRTVVNTVALMMRGNSGQ